VPFQ
jgi:integrase